MPRRRSDEIAQTLFRRIDAGEWADGGRLPTERALATEFGVARNTIRRAMGMIEQRASVSRHVGRGTFIKHPLVPLSPAATVSQMDGASPADILGIRILLEPSTAAFAATNASPAEINKVEEAHRAACAAITFKDFEHWDSEFHASIFSSLRNGLLRSIYDVLRAYRNERRWLEMKRRSFSDAQRRVYCREHARILSALRDRDARAARLSMLEHLRSVEIRMRAPVDDL